MRIALVTETFLPSTDGVVTRLVHAVDHFLDRGHEVLVIAPDLGVDEYRGARIVGMPTRELPLYTSREWSLPSREVKRALAEFEPDVVHTVNPTLLAMSGAYYAKKLGYPLITSYHTHLPKYLEYYRFGKPFVGLLWAYTRWIYRKAPKTLVTSNAMARELRIHGIEHVEVLPRGLDAKSRSPLFASERMRGRLSGGHPDDTLLVFVGRISREKEIERLAPLMRDRTDLRLAIVGHGPDIDYMEELFAGTNTIFTGFLHGDELSAVFASADYFVFPSVSETLGLVILEAMSSGTPVLAANSAPTREQITDRVTGMLWDGSDISTLATAIDTLDTNEHLRSTITRNALEVAACNTWADASEALLDQYQDVIARTEAAPERLVRSVSTR